MKRWLPLCVVLGALGAFVSLVALVAVSGIHSRDVQDIPPRIKVSGKLDPLFILYADEFTFIVTIELDQDLIDPSSVGIGFNPEGLDIKDSTRSLENRGRLATITQRYVMNCFGCVPQDGKYTIPSALVTYRYRSGEVASSEVSAQPLKVSGRVSEEDRINALFLPFYPAPPAFHMPLLYTYGARVFAATLSFAVLAVFFAVGRAVVTVKRNAYDRWSLLCEDIRWFLEQSNSATTLESLRTLTGECRLFILEFREVFPDEASVDAAYGELTTLAFARHEAQQGGSAVFKEREKLQAILEKILELPSAQGKKEQAHADS